MSMIKKYLVCTVLLCVALAGTYGQNAPQGNTLDLDMDGAVAIALKNNLGIEKEKLVLAQYGWAMAASWNTFVPSMSLSLSMTRLDDNSVSVKYPQLVTAGSSLPVDSHLYDYVYEPDTNTWSVGMSYNLNFNFNAAMIFGVYQTVLDWKNGQLSLETAEKKLTRDVKKTYSLIIILKENRKLMEEKLDAAEKRYKQSVLNRQTGVGTKIEELAAKVSYENLKPAYMEIDNSYHQSLLSFKQMVGIKDEVELVFTQGLPEVKEYHLDYRMLIDHYMEKKLEMRALKISLESLGNARNANMSLGTPTFFVSYIYDPVYMKDPLDQDNNWFETSDDWIERTGALTFGVSVPLDAFIPMSKSQMKVVNNEFAIEQTKKSVEQMMLSASREIQSIVLNIDKTLKSIETLQTNIELSQEVYSMTEDAYAVGTKDLLQVEDAENEWNNAKLNLLKQQYEYLSNVLDLEYSIDTDLDTIGK